MHTTPTGRRFSRSEPVAVPSISQELNDRLAKIFLVEEADAKVVTAPELLSVMQRHKRLTRRGCEWLIKEVTVYLTTASAWLLVGAAAESTRRSAWRT